jgi:hypothetical protein
VIVLKEEDEALTKCGLRKAMPPGTTHDDLMARYRDAKITFLPDDEEKLRRRL